MELSSVYVTPKSKFSRNTSSSPSEASGDEDELMAALKLSEGVTEKLDSILAKLGSLDSKKRN